MRKTKVSILATYIIVAILLIASGFFIKKEIDRQESLKVQENKKEDEQIKQLEEENKIDINQANLNFDNAMNKIVKDNDLIGISIVIFEEENIIHTYNYGYADKENNILVNDNTKYRIASISKLISTMGLMKLYDEGLFDLNDSIKEVTNIDFHEDTTFKDLLTHRAG